MRLWHFLTSLLTISSAAFAVWVGAELYEAVRGYYWPETTGRIITSEVRSKKMVAWRSYITYWPDIRYEYIKDEKPIIGDRIWFSVRGPGEEATRAAVAKYPVGKVVQVFVNPNDEHAAVLEKGVPWLFVTLFPASMLLTIILPLLIYVDVRSRKINIRHNNRFHGTPALTRRRP